MAWFVLLRRKLFFQRVSVLNAENIFKLGFFDPPKRNVCTTAAHVYVQVIFGALHVSDHLAYLEVDYTKAYLQCLVTEGRGNNKAAAVFTATS